MDLPLNSPPSQPVDGRTSTAPEPDGTDLDRRRLRRVVLASTVGTAIEYYDYFIFGTAAATVFPKLFFPGFSPVAGTLAAFGAFGAGFIFRPIGAAVAGHFGDRVGRKTMLMVTLLVMGLATFCIGLLPPFSAIGIWAPILLVFFRLAQGFGIGGETPGAMLMCVEHARPGRRGLFGAWPQSASPIGLALSTGAFVLVGGLNESQFGQWGWRIPFLLSGVLVLVGIFVRLKTQESPEFEQAQRERQAEVLPLREFARSHRFAAVRGVGMYLGSSVTYFLITTFLISYATTTLRVPRSVVLDALLACQPVFFLCCLAGGALSDRFGRRTVYTGAALLTALMAFPAFLLIAHATATGLFFGTLLLGGPMYVYVGVQGAYYAEMFEVRVRYTGTSLSIAIGALVGGAFTPTIGTLLVQWFDGDSTGVALLAVAISLITAAAAAWGRAKPAAGTGTAAPVTAASTGHDLN